MAHHHFVGRAAELTLLEDLLTRVASGIGAAGIVDGEQGIGKTTLLREALGRAGALGCTLWWGAADELRQRMPLWVMTQCLTAPEQVPAGLGWRADWDDVPLGDWGESAGPPPGAAWSLPAGDPVATGVERLLARVDRLCALSPVVLVVEDLQWADEASLLVWQRLASAARQMPLLLTGSLRPAPGHEELGRLRRALGTRGGTEMSLTPLATQELSLLATGLAGGKPGPRLAAVVDRAGGNPLYARELLDALIRDRQVRVQAGVAELAGPDDAQVPTSLAAAIQARLDSLRPDTAGVLQWAAVLGQEFTVADLAVVCGRAAWELVGVIEEAVSAGVLGDSPHDGASIPDTVAGPRLAFRHGLIRQVLYDSMPQDQRDASHLQAAEALAASGAALERVAAQLTAVPDEGGDWVLDWLADAAPVLTYRAPRIMARLVRGALTRIPDGDPRRLALETAFVTVASLLRQADDVERVGPLVLARTGDPDQAARVAWLLTDTRMRTGRNAEAIAVTDDALARPGLSEAWAARLLAQKVLISLVLHGPSEDMAELAAQVLARAERSDDRIATGYAHHALFALAFMRMDRASWLMHIDQGLAAIGDDPQTTDLRLLMLANRCMALSDLNRYAEAGATIREALNLAERTGTPRLAAVSAAAAYHYYGRGQWDEAVAVQETAAEMSGLEYASVLLHGLTALIAVHRDDDATAQAHLRAAQEQARDVYGGIEPWTLLAAALAAEHASGAAEALAILVPCLEPGMAERMTDRFTLLATLTRLALAASETATAGAAAQAADEEASREPLPIKTIIAGYCRGLIEGDPAPVLAAAAYFESAELPLERAEALEDAAVQLAARGDLTAARRAFSEANKLYADLGAHLDARRAASRLAGYGIRPADPGHPARPARGWEALTPTEIKIAYMVAQGLSNPDIAAELWLSRNTIQNHISHILAKLSARSRTDIVLEVLNHPAA